MALPYFINKAKKKMAAMGYRCLEHPFAVFFVANVAKGGFNLNESVKICSDFRNVFPVSHTLHQQEEEWTHAGDGVRVRVRVTLLFQVI